MSLLHKLLVLLGWFSYYLVILSTHLLMCMLHKLLVLLFRFSYNLVVLLSNLLMSVLIKLLVLLFIIMLAVLLLFDHSDYPMVDENVTNIADHSIFYIVDNFIC